MSTGSVVRVSLLALLSILAFGQAPVAKRLGEIRRICVENLAGEPSLTAPVREIAIASLFALDRFTITEKCEKADGMLKGAIIERSESKVRGEGRVKRRILAWRPARQAVVEALERELLERRSEAVESLSLRPRPVRGHP